MPEPTSERSRELGRYAPAEKPEAREQKFFAFATETRPSDNHPEHNEDVALQGENWSLVCDGMGGTFRGEEAARAAAKAIRESLKDLSINSPQEMVVERLKEALLSAQKAVVEKGKALGSRDTGTTATLTFIIESGGRREAVVAWVGDTRVYKVSGRDKPLRRLTTDHGRLQGTPAYRDASPEERERLEDLFDSMEYLGQYQDIHLDYSFRNRNVVERCLGADCEDYGSAEPEIVIEPAEAGDEFWTLSDGVHGNLLKPEIVRILQGPGSLEERGRRLLEAAHDYSRDFSTERAHPDDMTAVGMKIST
ncbi:hypothetical protein EPN90_03230 [Patescibacteria group bacterium]|nr:MAG: hypothetical protein EPN90_03230 [Patescibacteria group bacterium]